MKTFKQINDNSKSQVSTASDSLVRSNLNIKDYLGNLENIKLCLATIEDIKKFLPENNPTKKETNNNV